MNAKDMPRLLTVWMGYLYGATGELVPDNGALVVPRRFVGQEELRSERKAELVVSLSTPQAGTG